MADIELVIKIPEDYYNYIKNISDYHCTADMLVIKNGIPLPKGHGRLIDVDALKMNERVCGDRYLSKTSLFVANKIIEQALTIIEADKEVQE